jgi:hypothetical protein
MKKHYTILFILLASWTLSYGQSIPNYIPVNGLVGWWPFNGNADDMSSNNYIGIVNGASLTIDRFGVTNSAYSFNGIDNYIQTNAPGIGGTNSRSISFWIKTDNSSIQTPIDYYGGTGSAFQPILNSPCPGLGVDGNSGVVTRGNENLINNQWHHCVLVFDQQVATTISEVQIYIDGEIQSTVTCSALNPNVIINTDNPGIFVFGKTTSDVRYVDGEIDDIGIWERALTEQEIIDLYNAVNCINNTAIIPQNISLQTGGTATFIATTSDPNSNYIWQSNFGQGYQTLIDVENYSGTNTSSLNIANIQLSEHNQPIRVITTSGECVDTSNIATISILDTCVTSINDTTFITVTDTLVINTLITGTNPPNNSNTIKVYPNPANSHITIEYGDFEIMNGYQLRIENSLGQEVFQTSITQESDYLDLNSWSGNGLYFVHIVDPQGNTIDIRKIVLQ